MRAIGYVRVSTDEQGESGAGMDAQKTVIQAEVARRGWDFETMYGDVASGKSLRKRDDLGRALRTLAEGEADVLVVAKLDRLSRSVLDFANLMEKAGKEGWSLVVLDLGVDTTTPNGELIANIMIALAQWERRIIGERTRAALQAVQARGTRVGRKSNISPEARVLVKSLRTAGHGYHAIAKMLNEQDFPTAQGGRWHASTVRHVDLLD